MMTETELKKILRDFHSIKAQVEILKNCLDIRKDESTLMRYEKWSLQVKILMDSIAILIHG